MRIDPLFSNTVSQCFIIQASPIILTVLLSDIIILTRFITYIFNCYLVAYLQWEIIITDYNILSRSLFGSRRVACFFVRKFKKKRKNLDFGGAQTFYNGRNTPNGVS